MSNRFLIFWSRSINARMVVISLDVVAIMSLRSSGKPAVHMIASQAAFSFGIRTLVILMRLVSTRSLR